MKGPAALPPPDDIVARSFALGERWRVVGVLYRDRNARCRPPAEALVAAMTDDELCGFLQTLKLARHRGQLVRALAVFVGSQTGAEITGADITLMRRALGWTARLVRHELLRRSDGRFATVEPEPEPKE